MTGDMISGAGLLPDDPDLQLIHIRDYKVEAFRTADQNLVIRGAVRDTKPAFLYWPTDPDPLVFHHMVVELHVTFGSMVITDVRVIFSEFPHHDCPGIVGHYQKLVGLSIARGFNTLVRQLFGGPRGCSHTTALLQAMGPIAMQSVWSMRAARTNDGIGEPEPNSSVTAGANLSLNTCHVWEEGGAIATSVANGTSVEVPLPMVRRLTALGIDPLEFRRRLPEGARK